MNTTPELYGDVEIVIAPARTQQKLTTGGLAYTAGATPPAIKKVLAGLATGLGEELRKVASELAPDEVEVELSLSMSEELKCWVIGLDGTQTFGVKLTWKKDSLK